MKYYTTTQDGRAKRIFMTPENLREIKQGIYEGSLLRKVSVSHDIDLIQHEDGSQEIPMIHYSVDPISQCFGVVYKDGKLTIEKIDQIGYDSPDSKCEMVLPYRVRFSSKHNDIALATAELIHLESQAALRLMLVTAFQTGMVQRIRNGNEERDFNAAICKVKDNMNNCNMILSNQNSNHDFMDKSEIKYHSSIPDGVNIFISDIDKYMYTANIIGLIHENLTIYHTLGITIVNHFAGCVSVSENVYSKIEDQVKDYIYKAA